MARDNDTSTGKFGVVLPVYNESRLALLLKKIDFTIVPHVVVVDDGSSDGSMAVAGNYPVTLLKHEKRTGVGAAIRTGLQHLKKNGFVIGVVMAGNNKDDPGDIQNVVAAVRGGADYVQGSRYVTPEKAKDTPFRRRVITRGVALLWSLRFARRLTDVTNGFPPTSSRSSTTRKLISIRNG
jgi:glycosyltransferase involved in cell wall biosynthesis